VLTSAHEETISSKVARLRTSGKNKNYNDTVDTPSKKINTHHIPEHCLHQKEISSLDCNIDVENVLCFF